MRNIARTIVGAVLVTVMLITGCANTVYESQGEGENMRVMIGEEEYVAVPETVWDLDYEDVIIGYLDNKDHMLVSASGNPGNQVLKILNKKDGEKYPKLLIRSDEGLNTFADSGIDRIGYSSEKVGENLKISKSNSTIYSEEIEQFMDVVKKEIAIKNTDGLQEIGHVSFQANTFGSFYITYRTPLYQLGDDYYMRLTDDGSNKNERIVLLNREIMEYLIDNALIIRE